MKKCSCCREPKEYTQFSKGSYSKDGYKNYCKDCDSKKASENYLKNKEKRLSQIKEWRTEHPAETKRYIKTYLRKMRELKNNKIHENLNLPAPVNEVIEVID